MVARRSFGAGFRFAHAGLVCWRCALKSTPRYKPILQQPLTIVPENRRKYVAQAKSQALSTETVVTQLDSSKPVKKNKENSTESSRSLQYGTLRESLAYIIKHPKNASSLNLIPHVVARRGSDLSLRRRGRYYTTSAVGGASRRGLISCLTCFHSREMQCLILRQHHRSMEILPLITFHRPGGTYGSICNCGSNRWSHR